METEQEHFKNRLGEVIREKRNARGMSQAELGEKAGIHRTYVSLLERGQKSPTLRVFVNISNSLNTEADDLLRDALDREETDGVC